MLRDAAVAGVAVTTHAAAFHGADVAFWSFVIGPTGAVLSIPLTLLMRALVLEPDPSTRWLRWLSGDRSIGPT